jgi:magnesium transporter
LITVVVRSGGHVTTTNQVDPAWLRPDSDAVFWVDLSQPTAEEARHVLSDVFKFHELSVEDALSVSHHPKAEAYDSYLYVILHGIDLEAAKRRFTTRDIDFFVGQRYLVTVHDGRSRSVRQVRDTCSRNGGMYFSDGPVGLMHRIVDAMSDNYRPEIERLEERMDRLERDVFSQSRRDLIQSILSLKRDIVALRQVALPQRDVISRLARREFGQIDTALAYRFRDVHDHFVRLSDEALMFQDRATSLVEAHLSSVSNRLNSVMKILTVITTIFMPLTFITGLFGMNVDLPDLGFGAHATFWVLLLFMAGVVVLMLWWFRREHWL